MDSSGGMREDWLMVKSFPLDNANVKGPLLVLWPTLAALYTKISTSAAYF